MALNAMQVPEGEEFSVRLLYRMSRWKRRSQLPHGKRVYRQAWHQHHWPLLHNYTLMHATHERLPPWQGIPCVATIHDVFAVLGLNLDREERERQIERYRGYARRCQRLLFVSEHTRNDFLTHIGFDESCADVVHLGVGPQFAPQSPRAIAELHKHLSIDGPYLLFIGLTNPNKNLPRLIQAFAASRVRKDHVLVIAGIIPDALAAAFHDQVAALGLDGRVKAVGYIADTWVPALYAGAAAYLFPSLYEGFGLPILEAMASGTPVLTSTVSSCPEVAAGHAVLVDPLDVDAIRAGIETVLDMPSSKREAARLYAAGKTWAETARGTLASYRRVIPN
jgi:glycosyltransferase involved in cell wall biosynthesis